MVKKLPAMQERRCSRSYGFDPWVRKIPWKGKRQPTPAFLPRKSHGQRSLVCYSLWGHKEPGRHDSVIEYTHTVGVRGNGE